VAVLAAETAEKPSIYDFYVCNLLILLYAKLMQRHFGTFPTVSLSMSASDRPKKHVIFKCNMTFFRNSYCGKLSGSLEALFINRLNLFLYGFN